MTSIPKRLNNKFLTLKFEHFSPAPLQFRLGLFIASLALVWLPLGLPIVLFVPNPTLETIAALGLLYGQFIWLVRRWGRRFHGRPQILQDYGLCWTGQTLRELLLGWGLGSLMILVLFAIQGGLGWLQWQNPGLAFGRIALEGFGVALGVGCAEEFLFRGWLLDELQRDWGWWGAMVGSSLLFALLHFIKPWSEVIRTFPQFPGLFLLGLTLVLGKRSCQGRLGINVGLHGGLVWSYYLVVVGELTHSLGTVPPWVTGIDQNPLAGLLGLLGLGTLALGFSQRLPAR